MKATTKKETWKIQRGDNRIIVTITTEDGKVEKYETTDPEKLKNNESPIEQSLSQR